MPSASSVVRVLELPGRVLLATALVLLGFYRRCISPFLPRSCRFYPSCSCYMEQALKTWGLRKGLGLGARRLLRCHPLHPGGYDPLPLPGAGHEGECEAR